MKKTYYFIAGLHRSGSTLLSSILNQNPRFYSGPLSPVLQLMKSLESEIINNEFYLSYPKPDQANDILASLINPYYSDILKPVIFDKNRIWPNHINYIEGYIKTSAKIICPVRNIDEILLSFLNLIHKNKNEVRFNSIDRSVIASYGMLTDYNRCDFILKKLITDPLESIKFALNNDLSDRLLLVEYNDLVSNPKMTFRRIYEFLGERYYDHDFDNIESTDLSEDENYYGLSGLHYVRPKLEFIDKERITLDDEIIERCKKIQFWRE